MKKQSHQNQIVLKHNNFGNTLIKRFGRGSKIQKGTLLEPNNISAHNNLGFVLANQGMLDEAIKFRSNS